MASPHTIVRFNTISAIFTDTGGVSPNAERLVDALYPIRRHALVSDLYRLFKLNQQVLGGSITLSINDYERIHAALKEKIGAMALPGIDGVENTFDNLFQWAVRDKTFKLESWVDDLIAHTQMEACPPTHADYVRMRCIGMAYDNRKVFGELSEKLSSDAGRSELFIAMSKKRARCKARDQKFDYDAVMAEILREWVDKHADDNKAEMRDRFMNFMLLPELQRRIASGNAVAALDEREVRRRRRNMRVVGEIQLPAVSAAPKSYIRPLLAPDILESVISDLSFVASLASMQLPADTHIHFAERLAELRARRAEIPNMVNPEKLIEQAYMQAITFYEDPEKWTAFDKAHAAIHDQKMRRSRPLAIKHLEIATKQDTSGDLLAFIQYLRNPERIAALAAVKGGQPVKDFVCAYIHENYIDTIGKLRTANTLKLV